MKKSFFLCVIGACSLFGEYTEKAFLKDVLREDASFKIIAVDAVVDSITFEKVQELRSPVISIEAEEQLQLLDETIIDNTLLDTTIHAEAATTALRMKGTHSLPGGATISLQGEIQHSSFFESDSSESGVAASLEVRQPLLRGAFKNDSIAYKIKVASLELSQSKAEQRRALVSSLTSARQVYWEAAVQKSLLNLWKSQQKQDTLNHNAALARYSLGETTRFDTLTTKLALLKSQQSYNEQYMTAKLLEQHLKQMTTVESLNIDELSNFTITGSLPNREELLAVVEEKGSSFSLLRFVEEELTLHQKQTKNRLLPMLDLSATLSTGVEGEELSSPSSDARKFSIALTAGYRFPIRRIKQEILLLEKRQERNRYEEELLRQKSEREVERLLLLWEQELAKLALQEEGIALSKERLTLAQAAFQEGAMSSFDLRQIEEQWLYDSIALTGQQFALKSIEIAVDALTEQVLEKQGVEIK